MNDEEIADAWQTLNGGDPPERFLALVREYRRRKGIFGPQLFGLVDFTVCTMLYDLSTKLAEVKGNG